MCISAFFISSLGQPTPDKHVIQHVDYYVSTFQSETDKVRSDHVKLDLSDGTVKAGNDQNWPSHCGTPTFSVLILVLPVVTVRIKKHLEGKVAFADVERVRRSALREASPDHGTQGMVSRCERRERADEGKGKIQQGLEGSLRR
jgi:hypothetical protein